MSWATSKTSPDGYIKHMLAISSDNLVSLNSLYDTVSGSYVNNAAVAGTLMQGGTTVYSFTLSYVASSAGNYQGTIPSTVTMTPDTVYTVLISATTGGGFKLTLSQSQIAEFKQG